MINKKLFKKSLLFVLIVELLSLNSFLMEKLMPISFFLILGATFILSVKNLKYGVYIVFSELVIGSLGYLFWLDVGGFRLSVRIGIWLVVMGVWLSKVIFNFLPNYSGFKQFSILNFKIYKNKIYLFLSLLFVFIVFGVLNGFLNNNGIKNIFFDFNGWLFFSFVFPVLYVLKNNNRKEIRKELVSVLLAAIITISFKTVLILYLFSHNFSFLPEIYSWIRDTRVGEITRMDNSFVRVFFQSHIYFLFAYFFVNYFLFTGEKFTKLFQKKFLWLWSLNIIFLSIIILGYSRSNWLGFVFGMTVLFLYLVFVIFKKYDLKKTLKFSLKFVSVNFINLILSLILILGIINIPFPNEGSGVKAFSLVSERTSNVTTEAGASSRWQLLPVLWSEVLKNPIIGKGFGSAVTYISNDPRVREQNPSGEYTTFTFEWGWLDIWLELGILGLLSYLFLIYYVAKLFFIQSKRKLFYICFIVCFFSLITVHFFSPYLNHPLGIGSIILSFIFLKNNAKLEY